MKKIKYDAIQTKLSDWGVPAVIISFFGIVGGISLILFIVGVLPVIIACLLVSAKLSFYIVGTFILIIGVINCAFLITAFNF